MSTPVVTDKWAGNFDCSICRRKRLVGSEFSRKALERYRKNGGPLKCKQCTTAQEEKERQAAAARKKNTTTTDAAPSTSTSDEPVTCSSCKKSLDASLFNRNQLSKGPAARRCRSCVEQAVQKEESDRKSKKERQMQELRQKIQEMDAKGNVMGKVRLESELSALEAEHVTGLKPIAMKSSGGRGRGRGRFGGGRGRGRAGRGASSLRSRMGK